jgi:hypothetical protein
MAGIQSPPLLPPGKGELIDAIVDAFRGVPHLSAIALGGSHARGTHRPDSDLDIGLYYRAERPFSIETAKRIARRFAAAGTDPVVTSFHEWGPWVNGGAWIYNDVCKVDLLYRDLDQLETTIREAEAGICRHDFDQQPPFGFRNVIYLGELACCIPLNDPGGVVTRLKASIAKYPQALKRSIISDSLWAAEFSFLFARDFAMRCDVTNAVGCMTRIAHYLVQTVFALNETYFINDKSAASTIDGFGRAPAHFNATLESILANPGAGLAMLTTSLDRLYQLFVEMTLLAGDFYQARFALGRRKL